MIGMKVIVENNDIETNLIFRAGDRFQAISFTPFDDKQKIVGLIHTLAENIAHDDHFGEKADNQATDFLKATL